MPNNMKLMDQLRDQLTDQSMWPEKWVEHDVQYGKLDRLELPENADQQLWLHRYLNYNMFAHRHGTTEATGERKGIAYYPKAKTHFSTYFGYSGGHKAMVDAVINKPAWVKFKAEMDAERKRQAGGVEEPFPDVPIQPADNVQAQTEIENENPSPVQQIHNADIQPPSPIVDASGPRLLTPEAVGRLNGHKAAESPAHWEQLYGWSKQNYPNFVPAESREAHGICTLEKIPANFQALQESMGKNAVVVKTRYLLIQILSERCGVDARGALPTGFPMPRCACSD